MSVLLFLCTFFFLIECRVSNDSNCQYNSTCDIYESIGILLHDTTDSLLIPFVSLHRFQCILYKGYYITSIFLLIIEPVILLSYWGCNVINHFSELLDCMACVTFDNGVNCTNSIFQLSESVTDWLLHPIDFLSYQHQILHEMPQCDNDNIRRLFEAKRFVIEQLKTPFFTSMTAYFLLQTMAIVMDYYVHYRIEKML